MVAFPKQEEAGMRPSEALERHRAEIRRLTEANRARNPRVFGSVLRGEDTTESDLDLVVDIIQGTSLFDLARLEGALEDLLHVPVQVMTPVELPRRARDRILAEARPV
jgi:predicted nucleotidyltransferase